MSNFNYPDAIENIDREINLWAQLKTETGAPGVADKVAEISDLIAEKLAELRALPDDADLRQKEPDDLAGIRALRPAGLRRQWTSLPEATYRDRIEGAILGRFAGCVLGSIVECWEIDKMERWAAYNGEAFPPVDYWKQAERPNELKYQTRLRDTFTRSKMDGVPTDDDIIYTQLGLLILEDYGPDFTVDDVGAAWMKYLPHAATAEGVALRNLHAGVPPMQAAIVDNPFMFWIGADIRSDPGATPRPVIPKKPLNSPGATRRSAIGAMASTARCTSRLPLRPPSPPAIRLRRWRWAWRRSRPIACWRVKCAGRWMSLATSKTIGRRAPLSTVASPACTASTPSTMPR